MVPSRHSKWLQSGSCRSLGFAPVRLPSRCIGYTTYLISGCPMVPATKDTLRSGSRRHATLDQIEQPKGWSGRAYSHAANRVNRKA